MTQTAYLIVRVVPEEILAYSGSMVPYLSSQLGIFSEDNPTQEGLYPLAVLASESAETFVEAKQKLLQRYKKDWPWLLPHLKLDRIELEKYLG